MVTVDNRRRIGIKRTAIFLMAFLFFCGVTPAGAQQVTFTASAPEAVAVGEQFHLTYKLNNEGREFRSPDLTAFDVLFGPSTSTSISQSNVNGNVQKNIVTTYTYILMAKKEGTYNLAPATIKVKSANYHSNSLIIKALPPDDSAAKGGSGGQRQSPSGQSSPGTISNSDLFMQMTLSKRKVYEQEGILVTFKLYSLVDVRLEDMKFPEFEGFLSQDIELNPQWVLENYKGRNYQAAVIKQTMIYPQRSGKITIDRGTFDASIKVQTRRESFFDDFFGGGSSMVKKKLHSPAVEVEVKPLPSGKPASFGRAVGSFTMKSEISKRELKANEAVTIKVVLSGTGNVKLLKNPEVKFPNDFEVYDPKVDMKVQTNTSGSHGSKTIEYMAIPRYAGNFKIPPVEFSYFDPKTAKYHTLKSEEYTLQVLKGENDQAGNGSVFSNFGTQESVQYLGKDIRYLKLSKPHFLQDRSFFFGSTLYRLIYLFLTVGFLVIFFLFRKQARESANIALVRTKKANKTARKRLKIAEKLLKEQNKEAYYEEMLRALWGYLSDKLNIPVSDLNKENVEAELLKYGVDETLSSEIMGLLNTCEFARYAPTESSAGMDQVYQDTVKMIGEMETIIKK